MLIWAACNISKKDLLLKNKMQSYRQYRFPAWFKYLLGLLIISFQVFSVSAMQHHERLSTGSHVAPLRLINQGM